MKEKLRKSILKLRRNHSPFEKQKKDNALRKKFLAMGELKKAKTILFYASMQEEVDTMKLISHLLKKKCIVLPRIVGKNIELREVQNIHSLIPVKFGILEPSVDSPRRNPTEIDLAVIPGVAFDLQGFRIGFGNGYFDRLLKKMRATTIGLAYEFQIIDKVPVHPYDVPVNLIITEKRIIYVDSSKSRS